MKSMHILHVVGARPNFMKAAPVMHALEKRANVRQSLVHTGQHYDANMSDVFFSQLAMPSAGREPGSRLGEPCQANGGDNEPSRASSAGAQARRRRRLRGCQFHGSCRLGLRKIAYIRSVTSKLGFVRLIEACQKRLTAS